MGAVDVTTLREVMTKDPVTTSPDATVAEAAGAMVRGRVGSLLVRDGEEVVGILTERDVLRAAGTDGDLLSTKVRDWMTREPTTAPSDQDTEEAVATMLASGFRHLPVTDGGHLVGIVSLRDLLRTHVTAPTSHVTEDKADTDDLTPGSTPEPVHDRRERMFEATRQLQRDSRPPEGDVDEWREQLVATVELVDEVVEGHIAQTEDAGGFFQELIDESGGRLAASVRRLGRDHERSTELVRELQEAVRSQSDPTVIQQVADELFAQLEAHRHRGADLLWQAYGVEIGGGD